MFGPDVVVSQHGADSHAWDPLAHLRVTTTAMAEAARLVDAVAHRWAAGRWLATGGGGYDAYRVVPRTWALTWLAGAHLEAPGTTPAAWRDRWAAEAALYGSPGMPGSMLDAPNAGLEAGEAQRRADARSLAVLGRVRGAVLPRLVREAEDRGWWAPALTWAGQAVIEGIGGGRGSGSPSTLSGRAPGTPSITSLAAEDLDGLGLAPRVVSPFDAADAIALLRAAVRDRARVMAATDGNVIVGLAVAAPSATEPASATGLASATGPAVESVLAVGVAPAYRGQGLGRALLAALVAGRPPRTEMEARVGVAERDVVDPGDVRVRLEAARRLLVGAGFRLQPVSPDIARDDPRTVVARLASH